jgi:predicted DNA-binding protein
VNTSLGGVFQHPTRLKKDHLAERLFMKSKYTAFRCPEELLERAKKRAEQQGRTLSNYVKNLIREDLEKTKKSKL